jgi:DNA-binding MarR family transcriptional regulator
MEIKNNVEIIFRQVCKAHSNKVNQILRKVNLHKGQPLLINFLVKEDGIPQSNLAKELSITPATVSAMVKRMEKAGFVLRKRNTEDERVSNVYLTEKGREVSLELDSLQNEMENLVFKGFSDEEKDLMKGFLERIDENLK